MGREIDPTIYIIQYKGRFDELCFIKQKGLTLLANPFIFARSPNGTRTRVTGVRGRRPGPLDDGTEMAGGQGFEPWFAGPEPAVLPLNDPPTTSYSLNLLFNVKKYFYVFSLLSGLKERIAAPATHISDSLISSNSF